MNALAGTGTLIRFAARRERVRVPVYLLILVALIASTAAQSDSLYSTQAQRDEFGRRYFEHLWKLGHVMIGLPPVRS